MPAGTIVAAGSLVSPGGQQGVPGPNAVSTDAGNQATFGSDNRIYVPDPTPTITSVRLRSFNAIGNPSFQIKQRNVGNPIANPANGAWIEDRWGVSKVVSTAVLSAQFIFNGVGIVLPGTNFAITDTYLRFTVTSAQASMAAGDLYSVVQTVEGINLRELNLDVSSLSLLVRSSVGGLKFGVSLRDPPTPTKSLAKLCTIPSANVWTLIQLPNIPVVPSGNFSLAPGAAGYMLNICLASGSTFTAPANDTWQNGNFVGALGQDNFLATLNATFDIAFVQHEPGSQCTTPIDKPFAQNYDECLRYFQKTYDYEVAVGAVNALGTLPMWQQTTSAFAGPIRFHKPMAKPPTMTGYSFTTGAANVIRMSGVEYSITSFSNIGKTGCSGINTATLPALALGNTGFVHYTADTSW